MVKNNRNLHIILRTCVPIKKSSRGGERPFNFDKRKVILKCLKSLLISCDNFKDRIFLEIIDDSSPKDFLEEMKKILGKHKIENKIRSEKLGGNGESMEACYKTAEKSNYDLIYFLEDDYFHLEKEIEEIFYMYDNKRLFTDNFVVHPTDYPERYINLEPSYIFLGKYVHWRSIFSSTGTFVVPRKFFAKNKKYFYDFADYNKKSTGGENETINKLWRKIPLISPLPSLAAHLDKDTLPYFIDWGDKLKETKIGI